MICLLRVGFDGAEEPDEALFSPVTDRLGNYRIERRDDGTHWELGRGAMGVTYRAVDTSLQRPVALKLIDSEWIKRGAEARERFMREARAAAALQHPNVATVYQFGVQEENGQYFCALELVDGETLETRVRRTGPLNALITIEIALQVGSALAAAEKEGLVHRDLKPGNLMLVESEADASVTIKVIDFGVAKALAEKPDAMGLTHGGFVGTPAFASPEQFTKAPVDVRSDIYSLGATLWYLLTGRMPFPGASVEEIRASHQLHVLPIAQLKAARVPSGLISLLMSMLALEPAARPGVRALTSKLQECRVQILDRWKTARRFALAAGLIAIATAAFVLFPRWHNRAPSEHAAPAKVPEKSIAVLPFENLSQDPENVFFAGGVQDEILTHLAKVADLKVISRTSVMQYTTGPQRNLREIGKQLGVAHLLEGSVQRDAKHVRINAQLIDARTDAHLWAQTYDRDLSDVFAIQSEIAQAIADQLQAQLSASEKTAIAQRPTADLAAFDLYTRARAIRRSGYVTAKMIEEAIDLLNQAVARDPAFFAAWFELAVAHDDYYFHGERTPTRLALAEAAIDRVRRLQPDAGEMHLALAWHYYYGYLDFDRARAEVAIAQRTLPNDPSIFEVLAKMDRRQGRWEESARNFERALELDPRNIQLLLQLAYSFRWLQRYENQTAILERALLIVPQDVGTRLGLPGVVWDWRADLRPSHATIETILAKNPAGDAENAEMIAYAQFWLALGERDLAAAERALGRLSSEVYVADEIVLSHAFGEGLVARLRGDAAAAHAAFATARLQQEEKVRSHPDFAPELCVLGLIDAALGRKEDALREGRRAVELLPVARDGLNGPHIIEFFAIICAWVGEKDLALQQLEIAARVPGPLSYGDLRLQPFWDPLRGDPRFEKIVASLAPKEAVPVDAPEKSIAVLPFENRSEDKENAFFADAMHENVLTSLVKIKELKVIGRASVMSYRDGTKRNLKEIGRELGVNHVLEGSVRRVANRIILNVNLTDVRDGRALWAERYDRSIGDSTRLHGELATEIARALRATLAPADKASLEEGNMTENPDAYVLYLRGRECQMRPEVSRESFLAAANSYQEALALDPRFPLARAHLAEVQLCLYGNFDPRPALLAEARSSAQEAVRLGPDCGEAHIALAQIMNEMGESPAAIRNEIAAAVSLLPNDGDMALSVAMLQANMGVLGNDEAADSYERAILLNPRDGKVFFNYAVLLYWKQDRPRARWASGRAVELSPDSVLFRLFRPKAELEWTGDVALAKGFLAGLPAGKDPDGRVTAARCTFAISERNFPEALRLLAACPHERIPFLGMGFDAMVPKGFVEGLVHFYAGHLKEAYASLDSARWMLEIQARENAVLRNGFQFQHQASDFRAHYYVALTYATMGWKDAAISEIARSTEQPDALQLAVLFAHLGDRDSTLPLLEQVAPGLGPWFKNGLRTHPQWDSVRTDPRFQKLLAGMPATATPK